MKKILILVLILSFLLTINVFAVTYPNTEDGNFYYAGTFNDGMGVFDGVSYKYFYIENTKQNHKISVNNHPYIELWGTKKQVSADGITWIDFFQSRGDYSLGAITITSSNYNILNPDGSVFFSPPIVYLPTQQMSSFVPTVANQLPPILVVAVGLMALIMGVSLIPRIYYRLLNR